MRKRLLITAFALTAGFVQKSSAQVDPHFSSYYIYPSWLNPALTGIFDGQTRISGIYRTQWGNVSTPYSTPGISVDFSTDKKMNYGVSLLQQNAGNGGYSYTTAYANLAFTGVRWGNGMQRLVLALQAGMIQRKFNPSKLTFGDQWNPVTGFNPANPTQNVISANNRATLDFGAGALYYDGTPGKKMNFFGGASLSHLTRPTDHFSSLGANKLPIRASFHAGARIAVSDRFSLTPNALYMRQGSASETMIGAYGQAKISDKTEFMIGTNYRFNDAIAPFAGFTFGNLMLGTSYDINVSDLGRMVKGTNSFEISLTYITKRKLATPEEEFVCPRL